jgi:hypothetical protein
MVKTYGDWLNEGGRDMTSPISIEIEAGKVKTYADPQAENWMGETIREELYVDLLEEFEKALADKDDTKLQGLLKDARDLPLFGQDRSAAWKMSQVDGVEQFRTGAEYRRWLTKYCINKIQAFLDWARNSESKK